MSRIVGYKNKAPRKDAVKNRALVLNALRHVSGTQVCATQIAKLIDEPLSNTVILTWIRRLSDEGIVKTEGQKNIKAGRVITVIE